MKNFNYLYSFWIYIKKHGEKAIKPSIRICINKIENRITFKIKTGYYLELLTPEIKKLLGNTKSKITKMENGENVPSLDITEVVLMYCNFVNNSYQQNSIVLYTFVPNKSLRQLLNISPENFIILKTLDSEFSHIDVWFKDQNPLKIQDKTKITLVIN